MKLRLLAVAGLVGVACTFGVQATSQAAPRSPGDARAHSAAAVGVRACRPHQLRLGNGKKVSEKTQQETRIFVLRNASSRRCGLDGYPVVSLLAAHGRVLPFRFRDRGDQMLTSASPHLVVLAHGARAYFGINKNACVGRSAATARTLAAWPLGQLTVRLAGSLDYCGRRDPGHVVDISPFEKTVRAVLGS
jgi:hypothetical protein